MEIFNMVEKAESLQMFFTFLWLISSWAFYMSSPFLIYEIWKSRKEERPFDFYGCNYWCPIAIISLVVSSVLFMIAFLLLLAKNFLGFLD